MNRFLAALQILALLLLGLCLLEVRRLHRSVEAMSARVQKGRVSSAAEAGEGPRDPASLLEELRKSVDASLSAVQDPIEKRLAEKRMDAAVAALEGLGPQAFGTLATALDSPAPAAFRGRVLEAMEGIDTQRAFDHALRIFRSPADPLLRIAALSVCVRTDADRVLPELVKLILSENERSFPPLGDAVGLAAEKGGPDVVRALLDLANHPERGRSSAYRAIEALGRLRSPEAVDSLRRIVLSEPEDGMIRIKSVQSLVEIQGEDACPFLAECAREERQETFRLFLENTRKAACK